MMAESKHYRIEHLPNGLIRVFCLTSKLAGCYHADGTYRHGDLRAATLADLLCGEERDDYLVEQQIEGFVTL